MIENNPYFFGGPVPGFPGYCVTPDGVVWSQRTNHRHIFRINWKKLRPRLNRHGYWKLTLYNDNGKASFLVHRLVLMAFVGLKPEGMVCCHNDGNRQNNNLDNLRWDTIRSNNDDMIKHKSVSGTKNPAAKLTENDVVEIRRLHKTGLSYKEISIQYSVTLCAIRFICIRKTWGHIP